MPTTRNRKQVKNLSKVTRFKALELSRKGYTPEEISTELNLDPIKVKAFIEMYNKSKKQ